MTLVVALPASPSHSSSPPPPRYGLARLYYKLASPAASCDNSGEYVAAEVAAHTLICCAAGWAPWARAACPRRPADRRRHASAGRARR
jgi:hypothetical protein